MIKLIDSENSYVMKKMKIKSVDVTDNI